LSIFKKKPEPVSQIDHDAYADELITYTRIFWMLHKYDPEIYPINTYYATKEGRDRAYNHLTEVIPELEKIILGGGGAIVLTQKEPSSQENSALVEQLKEEIKRLKQDALDHDVITELYKQLASKDIQIENLTLAFKELSFQMSERINDISGAAEKKIKELTHAVDIIDCSQTRIRRIEEENKFLKELIQEQDDVLSGRKEYKSVFTDGKLKKLNECDSH
jgi:predicted transcriptional regulator